MSRWGNRLITTVTFPFVGVGATIGSARVCGPSEALYGHEFRATAHNGEQVNRVLVSAGIILVLLYLSHSRNGDSSKQLTQYASGPLPKPAAERHLHKFGETAKDFLTSEKGPLINRTCAHGALRDDSQNLCELVVSDTPADHTKRFYIFRDGALSEIDLSVFDTSYETVVQDISARYGTPVGRGFNLRLENGGAQGETTRWRVENEHVWATSETTYHDWDNSTFTYTGVQILSDAEFHAQHLDDDPHASF